MALQEVIGNSQIVKIYNKAAEVNRPAYLQEAITEAVDRALKDTINNTELSDILAILDKPKPPETAEA